MRSRRHLGTVIHWLALGSLVGCAGEPTGFSGTISVRRFFAGVYAVMPVSGAPSTAVVKEGLFAASAVSDPLIVHGVVRDGDYPRAASAPVATVVLESSIITGLPGKIRVQGDAPFTRIVL